MSDIDLLSPSQETAHKDVQDQINTILGVNEAVQIMKCLQDDCCNGLYHCPFCNEKVFKPSRVTKTIDHVNLSHFPHAVYYKDLVILKCFQDCRTSGHYHCPVCCKEILKRLNFKEHLIHHIKDNNEDEKLIQAPNSKQPRKIKFSVFDDVELCCSPCKDALGKHYHCPICKVRTYNDVSSTLTHVWRCAETPSDKPRGRKRITLTTDQKLPHPKQAQTIKYHISIVRSPADLYLSRCEKENCCDRKFHCPLCTVEKFKPNYQNHLLEHFNVHWKNRVLIDGYASLICYSRCKPSKDNKVPFHFHCPFCGLTRQRRIAMEVHVDVCDRRGKVNHTENIDEDVGIDNEDIGKNDEDIGKDNDEHVGKDNDEDDGQDNEYINIDGDIDKDNDEDVGTDNDEDVGTDNEDIGKNDEDIDKDNDEHVGTDNVDIGKDNDENVNKDDDKCVNSQDELNNIEEASTQNEDDENETNMKTLEDNVKIPMTLEGIPVVSKDTNETCMDNNTDDLKIFETLCGIIPDNIQNMLGRLTDDIECYLCDVGKLSCTDITWFTHQERRFARVVGDLDSLSKAQKLIKSKLKDSDMSSIDESTSKHDGNISLVATLSQILVDEQKALNLKIESKQEKTAREINPPKKRGRPKKIHKDFQPSINKNELVISTNIVDSRPYNTRGKRVKVYNTSEYDEVQEKISKKTKETKSISETNTRIKSETTITDYPETENLSSSCHGEEIQTYSVSTMTYMSDEDENLNLEFENKMQDNIETNNSLLKDTTLIIPEIRVISADRINPLKGVRCPVCNLQFGDFSKLIAHFLAKHPEDDRVNFPCDICEKLFQGKPSLDKHVDNKHGPHLQTEYLSCQHCYKKYKNTKLLAWHLSYTHKVSSANLSCKKCEFKANSILELRKHNVSHRGQKTCEQCGRHFKFFCHLKTHLETVHKKSSNHTCEYCGKVFYHHRYLKLHLKRHTGVKNHICHICNSAFYETNTLKTHIETHYEEKDRKYRYICSYCGSKYNNKTNFEEHQNKHTGNKPHKCQFCEKAFGFKSMLSQHIRFSHSDDKPFKCEICEKCFKVKIRLTQHMTTHTGISKHACPHCHKPFTCGTSLKKHLTKCKWISCPLPPEQLVVPKLEYVEISDAENQMVIVGTAPQNLASIFTRDVKLEQIETEEIPDNTEMLQTAEEELFVCSECNVAFSSLQYAQEHIISSHT